MSAHEGSLRRRHAEQTRRLIVEGALDLFARQGFEETTVDQIATAADISPRTFFRYFPTKEAVLFDGMEERLDRIRRFIGERPGHESPFEALVAGLYLGAEEMVTDARRAALMRQLMLERPQLRNYQRNTIVENTEQEILATLAARSGLDPDDLGLRAVVAAVTACFDVALRAWIEDGGPGPFRPYFTNALGACANAFGDRSLGT